MEPQKFNISYKFRGYTHQSDIVGIEQLNGQEVNFEVWEGGIHLFTLQPLADENTRLCWTIEGGFIDQDADWIQTIGDAITSHYQ